MLDDDFDYEFPDDPEPSHFMVDDDDTWDEGEPTLRMLALEHRAGQGGCMTRDEMIVYLDTNGPAIGDAANAGNTLCKQIVALYTMHYRCPGDPGVLGLLIAAVEDHTKATGRGLAQ